MEPSDSKIWWIHQLGWRGWPVVFLWWTFIFLSTIPKIPDQMIYLSQKASELSSKENFYLIVRVTTMMFYKQLIDNSNCADNNIVTIVFEKAVNEINVWFCGKNLSGSVSTYCTTIKNWVTEFKRCRRGALIWKFIICNNPRNHQFCLCHYITHFPWMLQISLALLWRVDEKTCVQLGLNLTAGRKNIRF